MQALIRPLIVALVCCTAAFAKAQCSLEINYTISGLTVTVNAVGSGAIEPVGQISWNDPMGNFTNGLSGTFTYPDQNFYVIDIVYYDNLSPFDCVVTEFIQLDFNNPCTLETTFEQEGNSVTVLATGTGAAAPEVVVNWGDGTLENGDTLTHIFTNDGTYNVCASYIDQNNPDFCTVMQCETVQICQTPLNVALQVEQLGAQVNVTASGNGANNELFTVNWGDGTAEEELVLGSHSYTAEGEYSICVTYTDIDTQCSATSCATVQIGTLISELKNALPKLEVLPNPVHHQLQTTVSAPVAGNMELRLLSLTGELVRVLSKDQVGTAERTYTFDIHDLPQGLYLLQATSNGRYKSTARVVKL